MECQTVAYSLSSLLWAHRTEIRIKLIEKETLTIVYAFKEFDQLLFGKGDITVHTNHKPLEAIFKRFPCTCSPSSAKHAVQLQGRGSQGLHPSYRWHAISSIFANVANDNNLTYKIIITSFVEYKIHNCLNFAWVIFSLDVRLILLSLIFVSKMTSLPWASK